MKRRAILVQVATVALMLAGCRTGAPPRSELAVLPRATLAGRVSGPLGSGPVAGRQVVAVEIRTGARYATKTHVSGGFTLFLPPGRYRLDVALARGERVVEAPDIVELEAGALEREADIVVAGAGRVQG